MNWWFYSLWDILPLPILIGMFIWTFSMCLFSVFLLVIVVLLHQRSSPTTAELISMKKDLSTTTETIPKGGFSCDSLSLLSIQTTHNDNNEPINSFYLRNCVCLKENEKIHSLPSIKLRPATHDDKQMRTTLPARRSIIKDLTSVSSSFNDKKIQQSIDSLFSKDSLAE